MEGTPQSPSDELLAPKKSSLDNIIDQFTADLQRYDGKYMLLGEPSTSEQSIWRVTRPQTTYFSEPDSLYYPQGYEARQYPPYYNAPYENVESQYQNYLFYPQTNTSQPPPEYGSVFGNGVAPGSVWSAPRGTSGTQTEGYAAEPSSAELSNASTFSKLSNSVIRRPRIVAEVKPMRPSYSDVLAKPAAAAAPVKPTIVPKVEPVVKATKKHKGNKEVKSNGTPSTLKRQLSSGSEEQMFNGYRSHSLEKKSSSSSVTNNENNHVWSSSFENLTQFPVYNDLGAKSTKDRSPSSNLNSKKTNRKGKNGRQNDNSEPLAASRKPDAPEVRKKKAHATNLPWGVGEQSPVRERKKPAESKKTTPVKTDTAEKVKTAVRSNVVSGSRKTPKGSKRREGPSRLASLWKRWREKTSEYAVLFFHWFVNLLWDVLILSIHLGFYLFGLLVGFGGTWCSATKSLMKNVFANPRNWWQRKKPPSKKAGRSDQSPTNLTSNISLPQSGDEAMKRLFACKGKDPYSILGVTKNCPDDVIKKYYKRQAVLVHPDKNSQPGAEEAFKILVHAFELIGEPERRKAYDRCVMESMEDSWGEFSNLLSQLQKKMEYAANTIRCTNCGNRHKRTLVDRPLYAARFCAQCKIHHSSREGDIWAESAMLGWLWRYYACMDGAVYDISEWAACQAENLRHLKANTHVVQYRIVVGKHRPPAQSTPSTGPQSTPPPPNCSDQDLEDFLSTLYGHGNAGTASGEQTSSRFRKKGKKKK